MLCSRFFSARSGAGRVFRGLQNRPVRLAFGLMLFVLLSAVTLPVRAAAPVLEITFTLPEIRTGQYQRPYVAVWIEDEQGASVKTLTVWHGDSKWLKDLRRWWRKTGRYLAADSDGRIDGISGASRSPGEYQLQWDGSDQSGQPVVKGRYVLVMEAAREHGSRTLLKESFDLPDHNSHFRIKPGKELGPVSVFQP